MITLMYNEKTFNLSHDEKGIVTVSIAPKNFDEDLRDCNWILSRFQMSKTGSMWGSDRAEKAHGRLLRIYRSKSGVGPRKFKQGLKDFWNPMT